MKQPLMPVYRGVTSSGRRFEQPPVLEAKFGSWESGAAKEKRCSWWWWWWSMWTPQQKLKERLYLFLFLKLSTATGSRHSRESPESASVASLMSERDWWSSSMTPTRPQPPNTQPPSPILHSRLPAGLCPNLLTVSYETDLQVLLLCPLWLTDNSSALLRPPSSF